LLVVETLGAGARVLRRRREVVSLLLDAVQEGRHESRAASPPPSLTAEGIVGGALSVLHGRLVEPGPEPLRDLTGQLMGMIVLPYLGASAARREIALPLPAAERRRRDSTPANPLHDLSMRLTYRTVRVLGSVATHPGASNRDIGAAADIPDQGQASKLLSRLEKLGLIENQGDGSSRGAPNAWTLTELGRRTHGAIFERQPIPGPAAV
jgi:DNA-binding MarR family transcriptional regulator